MLFLDSTIDVTKDDQSLTKYVHVKLWRPMFHGLYASHGSEGRDWSSNESTLHILQSIISTAHGIVSNKGLHLLVVNGGWLYVQSMTVYCLLRQTNWREYSLIVGKW